MALLFTQTGTERVDFGSASDIDNLTTVTHFAWINLSANPSATRMIGSKGGGGSPHNFALLSSPAVSLQFTLDYATDANAVGDLANFANWALNTWVFVAAVNDNTNAPKLYIGSLTQPLAEPSSYRTSTAPSGARGNDSANTLFVGNGNSGTWNQGTPGSIALYGIAPVAMSLQELIQQQFSRVPIRSDYLLFANLGFGAVNSVDWSGKARAGSVTGATLADHVPQGIFTGYEASYPLTTTEITSIASSLHDGHEYPQDTWNASSIWFGHYGTSNEWACFHFQSVDVPKDATIESATLRLREHTHEGSSYTVNAKVRAQLIANASPPDAANLPSDMTLTTAGTDLDVLTDNWTDTEITDVDVKTSVQEVVDQASWAANNALNIVIENDGTTGDQDVDVYNYAMLASYAAILTIVYSLPEPAGGASVSLATLSLASAAVSLSVSPGAATISASTLTLASSAVNMSVQATVSIALTTLAIAGSVVDTSVLPGGVSVSTNTLAIAGSLVNSTVLPGSVTALMNTLPLAISAVNSSVQATVSIAMASLALSAAAQDISILPGSISVTTNTLLLISEAQTLSVSVGAVTISLNALILASSAVGSSVAPGSISITLDALTLAGSVVDITATAGIVIALNTLSLISSAVTLGIVPGSISVLVNTLTLLSATEDVLLVSGTLITLSTLALQSSLINVTVLPGSVSVLVNALPLSTQAVTLSILPGSISVSLNTLSASLSLVDASVLASVSILLSALTLYSSLPDISVIPGSVTVVMNTLILAASIVNMDIISIRKLFLSISDTQATTMGISIADTAVFGTSISDVAKSGISISDL